MSRACLQHDRTESCNLKADARRQGAAAEDASVPDPTAGNEISAALGGSQRAFIDDWATGFRFNPYRNYPYVSAADSARLLADAAAEVSGDITHLWQTEGSTPAGMLRILDLSWDTALYGRRMGLITHICGDLDGAGIARLIDQTDFAHLAVRADVSNLETQHALARAGFLPADTILTYLHDPAENELVPPPSHRVTRHYVYRPYDPSDRESILRITAHCYARYPGRYHSDPSLSDKGPDRYVLWAEKCMDGFADQICVAESRGRVVGYIAFRYDRRLYRMLGLGCYGGAALGASRGGDYASLLRYTLECPKRIPMHFAECQTQIDNYRVHRIYQDMGLHYVRAEHTYHLRRA